MQITVFGASGKVGQLVVAELLRRDYQVVVFVHNQSPFEGRTNLKIVKGDIHDVSAVRRALAGSDAVISALGSWHTPKQDILTAGMKRIIPAMQKTGVKRIVSLTGHEAQSSDDPPSLFHRFIHRTLKVVGMKVLADGDEHIRLLEVSKLDWTVIRSPVMNNFGKVDSYKLIKKWPWPWQTVNRQSVAFCMVGQLKSTSYLRQSPFIVRGH